MILDYAKSKPIETITYHTNEVLNELVILKKLYGKKIVKNKIRDEEQFWLTIEIACKYHDCGKIFIPFQNEILKKLGKVPLPTEFDYTIKHEQLSPLFIPKKVLKQLDKVHQKILLQAIYYHHERNSTIPDANIIKEIWEKDIFPRIDEIEEKFGFPIAKEMSTTYLNKVSRENRIVEENECYLEYCLIKGIVHRCDHSGSAHLPIEVESKHNLGKRAEEFVTERHRKINDLQEFCKENKEKNILGIASTGYGKTEAAAIWADQDKTIYTLPFRISLNDIFNRMNEIMEYQNVGLLHSNALDYILEEEHIQYPQELYEESKIMGIKVLLSTIHQFFYFALKYQGYEKIYSMLSHTKVIIDEIQAYQPKVTAIILQGLKMINKIGGRFMIMTATLPGIYQEHLEKDKIPLATKSFYSDKNRHKIKMVNEKIENDINEIIEKSKKGKVLVIANTVDKAIELYEKCKKNAKVKLLHARFIEQDKAKLEQEIKQFARSEQKGIWISTQIVEASLDIDFDYLYTEMSTLDSLFQRIGRCYRSREYQKGEPNIKIYTKEPSGIQYVYDKKINELSTQMLKDYDGQILREEVKAELVKKLYSREVLQGTNYLEEFEAAVNVLENMGEHYLTEKEAKDFLNDIKTVTVIPKQLYEENISLLERYKQEEDHEKRNEILKQIRKLCMNILESQARTRITEVGYGVKRIFFIHAKYDKEKGLLLKEKNDSFEDRSF